MKKKEEEKGEEWNASEKGAFSAKEISKIVVTLGRDGGGHVALFDL